MNKILRFIINLFKKKKEDKKKSTESLSEHGLYEDGSNVPDWIYNGHYDCGDKD